LTSCASSNDGVAPEPSEAPTATPSAGSGIIAVIGDFGSGDENERAVAELVAARNPEAIVTTGDNVYSNAGYAALVGDYYGPFVAGGTFFPATGNHDYEQGIENFDDYFGYLNGQRDYTVVLGSAEFFVLDGEQGMASLDANHNQEMWLRRVVSASTTDYKIVIVHYPPFSSGNRHGSTPDYQWDFASMGIDLVLSGHDHIYERIEVGGVIYIVNGAGGKALYGCGDRVSGSAVCFDDNFGALFLRSTTDSLLGQFVAVDGTVVDEFSIPVKR
jgi:predicted phosphodiesterase